MSAIKTQRNEPANDARRALHARLKRSRRCTVRILDIRKQLHRAQEMRWRIWDAHDFSTACIPSFPIRFIVFSAENKTDAFVHSPTKTKPGDNERSYLVEQKVKKKSKR